MNTHTTTVVICFAVVTVLMYLMGMQSVKTDRYLLLGDCVDMLAEHDHFPGTPREAWDTYIDMCESHF